MHLYYHSYCRTEMCTYFLQLKECIPSDERMV
jgi:hypothetical protein